jgi:hypothetical protein
MWLLLRRESEVMRGSVSASALPLLLALRMLSRRALCAAKAITDGGARCCGSRSMESDWKTF